MIENLETLCLNTICRNFKYIQEYLEKINCKLPNILGEKIYENSLRILPKYSKNDIQFLSKYIYHMKTVNLLWKNFKHLKYYDFLIGKELDNFILSNESIIQFNSNKYFIKIKNLIYINYQSWSEYSSFESLFKFCKITNSLKFQSKFYTVITNFNWNLCFKSLEETVKIIDLKNIPLNYQLFLQLLLSLKNKRSLIELNLWLKIMDKIQEDSLKLRKCYLCIPNTLIKFRFKINKPEIKALYVDLPVTLKRLKNLADFSLNMMPSDELIAVEILKSLKKYNSGKLENLNLNFRKINKILMDELCSLFEKSLFLNKFYINTIKDTEKKLMIKFFKSMKSYSNNLKDYKMILTTNFKDLNDKNFQSSFPKRFSSLEIINFEIFSKIFSLDEKYILEIIKSASNNLKILRLDSSFSRFLIENLQYNKLNQLTELFLSSIRLSVNIHGYLFKGLTDGNCGKTLKTFEMNRCHIIDCISKDIGKFLQTCSSLQIVKFKQTSFDNDGEFVNIILGLQSCKESLQTIHFNYCEISNDEGNAILDLLKQCSSIQNVSFKADFPSTLQLCPENIFDSINNSKHTLESITIINCKKIKISPEEFHEISNTFYKLMKYDFILSYDE